jgi:pyruvate kinase
MLSAETATGVDPVAAVTAMASLCRTYESTVAKSPFADAHPQDAAVTAAAATLASRIGARVIVSLTTTGYSASMLAACRPRAEILAVSPSKLVCRQLQLRRNVTTLQVDRPDDIQHAARVALSAARDAGLLEANERVVICASRKSPRSDADSVWLENAPD